MGAAEVVSQPIHQGGGAGAEEEDEPGISGGYLAGGGGGGVGLGDGDDVRDHQANHHHDGAAPEILCNFSARALGGDAPAAFVAAGGVVGVLVAAVAAGFQGGGTLSMAGT